MKKKVTLSLDARVYDDFKEYCENNAIMLSKKVELWIEDFMIKEKENQKNQKENQKSEKEVKKR
jgi:hypothetical protein